MARLLELQQKLQSVIEITCFKENIASDFGNVGLFWSTLVNLLFLFKMLPLHCYLSLRKL